MSVKATKKKILAKLLQSSIVELKFRLHGSLISRHTLSMNRNKTHIEDYSSVDGSTTKYPKDKYFDDTFYGESIAKGNAFFDE